MKIRFQKNSEYGFTLIAVLMVLVVLSILGLSINAIASNTVKTSTGERDDQSVFYVAEAGVVSGLYEIEGIVKQAFQDVNDVFEGLPNERKKTFNFEAEFYSRINVIEGSRPSPSFEASFGETTSASVTVRLISENPWVYEIESIGNIGSKTRTVTQEFTINLNPTENERPGIQGNMALHVSKKIDMGGSVKIIGDASIESENPRDVVFSGTAGVTGELFRGYKIKIDLPPFPTQKYEDLSRLSLPANRKFVKNKDEQTDLVKDGKLLVENYLTQGYTLNLSGNMKFNEIVLKSNYTLIINVGNSDKEILVDHLNLTNGHIKIIGSGKLTIHVKDKITMGSGSTVNGKLNPSNLYDHSKPGNIDQLQLNYKGNTSVVLGGDQKVYGSLYAESANITIGNGGGFIGNIYTGGAEVKVNGGTWVNTQLFLAPNAEFILAEGGNIKGLVIADSFIATGGGSLTYDVTNPGTGSDGSEKNYGDGENIISKGHLIEK